PLRTTTILDEPVGNRLHELVRRVNREDCAQSKRRRFHAAFRPPPVDAVLSPVRRPHHWLLGVGCWLLDVPSDKNRSNRPLIPLHAVLQIFNEYLRPVAAP